MTLEGKMLNILQHKDATAKDIAKELDVDTTTVKALLLRLKKEGFLVEVG